MNQISFRYPFPLILILILLPFQTVHGEPCLSSDDEMVRIAQIKEPLSVDELINASLIASGTGTEDIPKYSEKMAELLASAPGRSGTLPEDAEMLLEWMHENVLIRYIRNQTKMDTLIDKGGYNCVSSAVMYLILLRSRDIPVHGVLTADHAFCRVENFDVETTTAYGFDPGTRREAVDSFTGRTGFSYVPPGNYRQRQDIGEKELISLIYQNRLVELQRQRKWEDAVGPALDRWTLAGSEAAENDFRISITNYAADLDRRRMELEGLVFLNEAAMFLGENHGLEDTASALLGNAVTYYLWEDEITEARVLLDNEELTALIPEDFISRRRQEVREKSLEITLKTASFEEASAEVNQAYSDDFITEARWGEFTMFLWSNEARRCAADGKWLAGWLFLNEAPAENMKISGWSRMADTYSYNTVVVYHNRFAEAVRNRDFSEARKILDEALVYFPDSPMLLRDRNSLDDLQ